MAAGPACTVLAATCSDHNPTPAPPTPRATLLSAAQIMTDYRVNGLVLDNYRTTLPLKKGLSSSAAICVMVARAFNRVYDLKVRPPPGAARASVLEPLPPSPLSLPLPPWTDDGAG